MNNQAKKPKYNTTPYRQISWEKEYQMLREVMLKAGIDVPITRGAITKHGEKEVLFLRKKSSQL